jgi:hypothetical protein
VPERSGSNRWRRLAEICAGGAKSVFHFDVQGSVAKSTHAGLPWLRYVRQNVRRPVHFWPFDGWTIPPGGSAIVEVYPRLWRLRVPTPHGMTEHELDAHIIARTLRDAEVDGRLERWLMPEMSEAIRADAEVEGWILGADPARLAKQEPGASGKRPRPRTERRRLSPSAFVSSFFGMTLAMYPPFTGTPRVHASNRRGDSSFAITTAEMIEGDLPPIASRLVVQWIECFRDQLLDNWQRGHSGLPLYKIAPLE